MKPRQRSISFLLLGLLAICPPMDSFGTAEEGFERYSVILSRMPFGDAPPEPQQEPAPIEPTESFAKNLRVCSIMEEDNGNVKVGIVDTQSNKNFLLREGEKEDGIELLSASIEDEEAVLQKGSEVARINLGSGEVTSMTSDQMASRRQTALASGTAQRRTTYQDRRKARQNRRLLRQERALERKRKQEEKRALVEERNKKYTGAELRKQLQEYNLEAIRQGLPALPIELTEEQDNQLVAENILPPRNASQANLVPVAPPNQDYYEDPLVDELPLEELLLEEEILEEVLSLPESY